MSYVGVPPFGQTVRTVTEVTAVQDQVTFYPTGGYLPGYIDIELDGSDLGSQDFTATDGLSVVLAQKAGAGSLFRSKAFWPVAMVDTMRRAEINGIVGAGGWAMRNRLINGDMRVDQRNAGASITPSNTGASYGYPVDRFFIYNNTAVNFTAQRSTVAPAGFTYSTLLSFASTITPAAGVEANFSQWIEGFNIADFGFGTANAQPVTLSFWVRSSVTGTFGLGFGNANGSRTYGTTYVVNAANTFEYKTVTIPGDTGGGWATDNQGGLFVRHHIAAGSNFVVAANNTWGTRSGAYAAAGSIFGSAPSGIGNFAVAGATFYATGVQLEKGSYATPFDFRPIGTELQLCQRYYYKMTGAPNTVICSVAGNGNAVAGGLVVFPVTMRASPTFSQSGLSLYSYSAGTISNFNSIYTSTYTPYNARINWNGSGFTGGYVIGEVLTGASASNYADFSAEL